MHQELESLEEQDQEECSLILEDLTLPNQAKIKRGNIRWQDNHDISQLQMIISQYFIQIALEIQSEHLSLLRIRLHI